MRYSKRCYTKQMNTINERKEMLDFEVNHLKKDTTVCNAKI